MDILGIGIQEIVLIVLLAIIVLGPKEIVKSGKTIGRFLRTVVTSPAWGGITRTSKEIRNLPTRLIREAGFEEEMAKLQELMPEGDRSNRIYNQNKPGGYRYPRQSAAPQSPVRQTTPPSGQGAATEMDAGLSAWTTPPDKPPAQAESPRQDQT